MMLHVPLFARSPRFFLENCFSTVIKLMWHAKSKHQYEIEINKNLEFRIFINRDLARQRDYLFSMSAEKTLESHVCNAALHFN